jgi:DNA end-binding protein Ku
MGITLRYPYEIRDEKDYFDDISDEKIPKDMLDLAAHIVDTKTGDFEPSKFEDQYEDAVRELLKRKQQGEKIEAPREREPAKVINLMDAYVGAWKPSGVQVGSGSRPHPSRIVWPRRSRPGRVRDRRR